VEAGAQAPAFARNNRVLLRLKKVCSVGWIEVEAKRNRRMIPLRDDSVSVESLRARVVLLRAKRGVALMDGKPIEKLTAEIASVDAQADALEDLESATSARAYTEAAAKQREGRSVGQQQLQHFTSKVLTAVDEAERAMRSFVEAYRSVRALYFAAGRMKHEIDGKTPTEWSLQEINSRFGFRCGALLAEIDSRSRHRLGPMEWHLHGMHGKDVDWVSSERQILEKDMK